MKPVDDHQRCGEGTLLANHSDVIPTVEIWPLYERVGNCAARTARNEFNVPVENIEPDLIEIICAFVSVNAIHQDDQVFRKIG